MFENKIAGSAFGFKGEEVTEGSRTRQMGNSAKCTFVPIARLLG
jgi:hypothetical protein